MKTIYTFMIAVCTLLMVISLAVNTSAATTALLVYEGNNSETLTSSESMQNRPLAIVRRFVPDVFVSNGKGDWDNARQAHQLFSSDTLRTGENGYAVVQFMDNSTAKVGPNSVLIIAGEITASGTTAARLAMELGEVFLEISGRNSDFEVATPTAVAAVKGTNFRTKVTDFGSIFTVLSGLVEVRNSAGQTQEIGRNQEGSVNQAGDMSTRVLSDDEANEIASELESRDEAAQTQERERDEDNKVIILRFVGEDSQEMRIRVFYREVRQDED